VILVNPETAKRKKLKDDDTVVVESRYGKIEGRLRVSELFHPDTVGVGGSYGLGTCQSNPLNRVGPNFNALLSIDFHTLDAVSGGQDTAPAVKVYERRARDEIRHGHRPAEVRGVQLLHRGLQGRTGDSAGVQFHRVVKYESGKYPNAKMKFLPMPCMHCQDPPV